MRTGLGVVAALAALLLTTGSPTDAQAATPRGHGSPTAGNTNPEAEVIRLTNAERRRAGCAPLTTNAALTRAARAHSADMANKRYFSHTSRNGDTWDDRETKGGFDKERTGGENIAYGYSATGVMNVWMHSPEHRENILNCKFTVIGVGYHASGQYWTQDFGY